MNIKQAYDIDGIKLNDTILANIIDIENYIINKASELCIKLSTDCYANEGVPFHTLNYTAIAQSIIMYPLSPGAADITLIDIIMSDQYPEYNYPKPISKYDSYDIDIPNDITRLVILPGDNIIYRAVDKDKVVELCKDPGTYIKAHPLTTDKVLDNLKSITPNVIGPDVDLYKLFNNVDTICTTSTSESSIYSILSNKELISINFNRDGSAEHSGFEFINNKLLELQNPKGFLTKILNSKMSCIFNSNDPNVYSKINNYMAYISQTQIRVNNLRNYL